MLHAATVRRLEMFTAACSWSCDVAAAVRGFECPDLLRVLPLEGLHLFRVLSL